MSNLKKTEMRDTRRATARTVSVKKNTSLSKDVLLAIKAAKLASATAVRISRALELSIQFIEKGKLIEVNTQGQKRIVKEIPKVKSKVDLSKGTKIWLKQKD